VQTNETLGYLGKSCKNLKELQTATRTAAELLTLDWVCVPYSIKEKFSEYYSRELRWFINYDRAWDNNKASWVSKLLTQSI
jgi:hypothetical protein